MLLYQKHKPQSFKAFVGIDNVIQSVQTRLKTEYPQNTLLFGKTGAGKTALAGVISKYILCSNKDVENIEPCNTCESCTYLSGDHNLHGSQGVPNVIYYNGADISIDKIRHLKQTVLSGFLQDYTIVILDEFQELTGSTSKSQKELLDLIEATLHKTYFILISMEVSKVSPAIRNRCYNLRLPDLSYKDTIEYLYAVSKHEGISTESTESHEFHDVLDFIAHKSDGSMRQAMTFLDNVIKKDKWKLDSVANEVEGTTDILLSKFVSNFLCGDDSTFLHNYFTKDNIFKVVYILNVMIRHLLGVKIRSYDRQYMTHTKGVSIECVKLLLTELMELYKYNYVTQENINFHLLRSFVSIYKLKKV